MSAKQRQLPKALSRYVLRQDYSRYDAADQATWRFILLHLKQHLSAVAHPTYLAGLERSALSAAAIPRIADVDAALSELGWGAVCVSGFLPPRVFQRFQALSILPIAADIRTPEHVAYTPAPDIVHEAAGHAPILVNPEYGEYLRRLGETGALSFSHPADHELTRAITVLSEVKEHFAEGSPTVVAAEQRLKHAREASTVVSEAARMARLYWWTAEYGLMGTPDAFRLYGAGLLSSLGEAVYCMQPGVEKRPHGLDCLECGYDITRPQPQLFVARDFEHLFQVLVAAEKTLAANQGIEMALMAAQDSKLPCRIRFAGSEEEVGTLLGYELRESHSAFELQLADGCRTTLVIGGPKSPPSAETLRRLQSENTRLTLKYSGEREVSGRVEAVEVANGRVSAQLVEARMSGNWQTGSSDRVQLRWGTTFDAMPRHGIQSVLPADELEEAPTAEVAPSPRALGDSDRKLRALYDLAESAWRHRQGNDYLPVYDSVHAALQEGFPNDWLLRWNLLENLLELGELTRGKHLIAELGALEERFAGREPIKTGLRSLLARVDDSALEAAS